MVLVSAGASSEKVAERNRKLVMVGWWNRHFLVEVVIDNRATFVKRSDDTQEQELEFLTRDIPNHPICRKDASCGVSDEILEIVNLLIGSTRTR